MNFPRIWERAKNKCKVFVKSILEFISFCKSIIFLDKKLVKKYIKRYKKSKVLPSPTIKQKIVKMYANKFSINLFIETGTFKGAMVDVAKDIFEKIYSIELDHNLYKNAKLKFSKYDHISIIQGDSSKMLPSILSKINQPCLFWLDAHYSEGITAEGELWTPIVLELNHIFDSSKLDHVLLIDDARGFKGINDWPTLKELKKLISMKRPNYCFKVKNDIIRVYKK